MKIPGINFLLSIVLCTVVWGCQPYSCSLEPVICYSIPQRILEKLPTPFSPLSDDELIQNWGKDLYLGKKFARELDLYRAITCFKSAKYMIPSKFAERQFEIDYEIVLAYYVGLKYEEAVVAFEKSTLTQITATFPAANDLFIILYDSYKKIGQLERADRFLSLINTYNQETAIDLKLGMAIIEVDFNAISLVGEDSHACESIDQFLKYYDQNAKSVTKAQILNAILPGAGYCYVGQYNTALTSFLVNSLFIAASYQLFSRGYIPAAIITTSLESGWYFGGINGAGLAAKEYNERLYERLAKETLVENRLFPIMMIQMGF